MTEELFREEHFRVMALYSAASEIIGRGERETWSPNRPTDEMLEAAYRLKRRIQEVTPGVSSLRILCELKKGIIPEDAVSVYEAMQTIQDSAGILAKLRAENDAFVEGFSHD